MVATSKGFAKLNTPPDRISQMRSNDWSVGSNKSSSILRAAHAKRSPSPSRTAAAAGKYSPQRNPNTGNNIASVRSSILSRGSTPQERFQNMQMTNGRVGGGYSSNKTEDVARADSFDTETKNHELFKKFEAAFNFTLQNNPGILPGDPATIESIKSVMFKVQKSKAVKEAEMMNQLERLKGEMTTKEAETRKQLDQIKSEMSNMDHQISQQKGEIARKKREYSKEISALEAAEKDLKHIIDGTAKDKEDMVKHLSFLNKSRMEVEKALKAEVEKVEIDRDALQKVTKERQKIQKVMEQNKSLEDEVDRMSEEASKKNQELQERKKEIKKLTEKNDATEKELEKEQQEQQEIAKTLETRKTELARTKLSSANQKEGIVQKRLASYMVNCGDSVDQIVESDARPFDLRDEDVLLDDENSLAYRIIDARVVSEGKARQEAEALDHNIRNSLLDVSSDEESVEGLSRSRRSSRPKEARRKKSSKRKEEEQMKKQIDGLRKKQIDGLRMELEEVRARNNIAIHDQEARDAEDTLRAGIRVNQRLLMSPPSEYASSPSLRHNHRDQDYEEERYHSFLHKDREPASPAYSRRDKFTSPSSRRYRLEDDDDRPSSRRNSLSRNNFSSPPSRRSSPYSNRITRSAPKSGRGGEYRSRYWE